jgi:thiol-disulfide isomerase/thioredoxin
MTRRYILLALAGVTLVACDFTGVDLPDIQNAPVDSTRMEDKDGMMRENEDMMHDDESMMSDDEGMMMEKNDDTMMEKEDDKMMEGDHMGDETDNTEEPKAMEKEGQYQAYREGVIGNGMESVLFFHASWCPYCKTHDGNLNAWYPGANLVNVYKIDYDTASDLKSRFGVVQQDTFIRIDGQGNVIETVSFPTEAQLKAIVTAQ